MDWNRIEGNWKQAKGKVKEQWGKLTDDDLDVVDGNREQLEGRIQERYGLAKDQARREVEKLASAALTAGPTDGASRAGAPSKKARTGSADGGAGESAAITVAGVRLTHPDRILFPEQGVTKRALAEYYLAVADLVLPHVSKRPISLVRCPRGREGECFFQKHASEGFPEELRRVRIREKRGANEYIFIEDGAGLVAAVQMGVLEVHVWGAHVDTLETPDRMVFDFDPDPSVGFDKVRKAAIEMRDRLSAVGLQSFCMATGGKGLHVVVPLAPRSGWDRIKGFSEATARAMADDHPELYLAKASKAARSGRIFIDYLRNGRGSTAIAPFSSRARKGAPVAWPIAWDRLGRLENAQPASIATAAGMLKSRKRDPWHGYFDVDQDLIRSQC